MSLLRNVISCSLLASGKFAMAAALCVNPGGTSGCYATIGAAVSAAKANSQINIAAGQYAESVTITKPLSLVGAGAASTILNAKGQANGIYIDGLDNAGLAHVLVTGMTVMNANFEGILVTNSSYVVIARNHVTANNQSINVAAGTCAGIPAFETSEAGDCGEGIHLMGADHSVVSNNISDLNAGGILISDETAPAHDNLIAGNSVHGNAYACGINMASHPVSPQAASTVPYGVFNNLVEGNNSSSNGLAGSGGAGIGIFAAGPGNLSFGNRVIGNVLMNNGHPGVSVHNHAAPAGAPGINLNDNVIAGNFISGNGADTADAATSGPTGINIYGVGAAYGIVISQNTIENEAVGVVMNNPGWTELHMNNLLGGGVSIANPAGVINASLNYFGCAAGPGASGCGTVAATVMNSALWLSAPVSSAPSGAK